MKNWPSFHQLSTDCDLAQVASITMCWLLFFLPLYAVIKSFTMSRKDAVSGSRMNLFVRPASFYLDRFVLWFFSFRADQEGRFYQSMEGEITKLVDHRGLTGSLIPAFELNGHSFEYGKGSQNPAIDLLTNGGVLTQYISYKITYDRRGRIIQLSVSQNEWCRFIKNAHHHLIPEERTCGGHSKTDGCESAVSF